MNQNNDSNKRDILVVDDNKDAATTLGMFLRLKGYEVRTCFGGNEALEAASHQLPDLIIMDLAMPGMDGYQTAAMIRKNYGLSIPMIALSGYGQTEDKRMAHEAGFDDHLVKPVDFVTLMELVERMLRE